MNELPYIPGEIAPYQLYRVIADKVDSSALARQVLAFTAAIAVNLTALGILQLSAAGALYTPAGQVVITQLDPPVEVRVAQN